MDITRSSQSKTLLHAIILTVAVCLTFFWITNESLSYYSLQLSAVLLLTLIFTHRILRPESFHLAESTISTIAVLLVVSSTGNLTSPLFFLNYFLLFELSLLLEPAIPLALSIILILFYFLTNAPTIPFQYLELMAFPIMTPLAYFFGKIYQKDINQKKEIQNLSQKLEELEEELVEEEIKDKNTPQ